MFVFAPQTAVLYHIEEIAKASGMRVSLLLLTDTSEIS